MRYIRKEFPSVKLWTSIGWIIAGLVISKMELEASAISFKIAAGASILMGIYCLSLPHTPPKSTYR